MAEPESNDIVYFIQILGAISILALFINTLFKQATFLSMCIIFASMIGLLLVQFEMSIRGSMNSQKSFMGILKKLFHYRNLIFMILLTSWVFDIYINNYTLIQNNNMPSNFYTVSNAYMWIVVLQILMIVTEFIKKKKAVTTISKGANDSVFNKMSQLYSTQLSSLNAIFNIVNFALVIILYVISDLFVTDG